MRRFPLLIALLLVVTTRREHARRSEESILDAQTLDLEKSLRRMNLELDDFALQIRQQHQAQAAMRTQLEDVRTQLVLANQHVVSLHAELDRLRAASATAADPLHPPAH